MRGQSTADGGLRRHLDHCCIQQQYERRAKKQGTRKGRLKKYMKNFSIRDTEVSEYRTHSLSDKKSSLSRNSCCILGVQYCCMIA